MTRDDLVAAALVRSFAALVTVHLALCAGIAAHRPRWRSLVALVVFPLAPYWGAQRGRVVLATLWGASAAAYGVTRWMAGR